MTGITQYSVSLKGQFVLIEEIRMTSSVLLDPYVASSVHFTTK